MGLLRRAGRAVRGQAEAIAEEPAPRGRAGLLHRSLDVLRAAAPSAVAVPSPASPEAPAAEIVPTVAPRAPADASTILAALRALPDDVELPSRLFTVLKDALGIARGALLLYDPLRMVYAPWASCGLDQTTLHRMRISLGAVGSFNALANGKPITIAGAPPLADYQKYFSSREFSSLTRLVMAPFIAEEKLVGALLIAEAAAPFNEEAVLVACLTEVCDAASPAVRRARGETMKAAAEPPSRAGATTEEQLSRMLSRPEASGRKFLFFSVSLEDYQRRILAAHRYLDPFRLQEDLRYFLGAFAADLGIALPLSGGAFLIGLSDVEPRDLDLLLHQLRSFLTTLFGSYDGRGADATVLRTRLYPDDGKDIADLASFLSP
jgi:hypothetical protein